MSWKKVQKVGRESERACGLQAGPGCTCAGRGRALGARPPWRGGWGCSRQGSARCRGWRFRGAVGATWRVALRRRPASRRGSPHPRPATSPARLGPSGASEVGAGSGAANRRGPSCGLRRPGAPRRRAGHLGLEGPRRERPCWRPH